ncbi:hypothetical protein TraAM80_03368 [Trypanosoma rangeli]|uniref:Uncharacterized protein n=1 Tax=Trypanosoma rangeli TaxID=5698 RepID=A0A422NPW6_TRYRA|nr:uncharacterized protein TraAM80_03368 [Trypanosoma rangeli]RNF07512.1 hypothetical protein TraAM80_03368 [Trypanosoma rangeli]|eukprot:RNF07512.1 hypothetical protein TraAM80_03368 [Trypanosoma rangeli]
MGIQNKLWGHIHIQLGHLMRKVRPITTFSSRIKEFILIFNSHSFTLLAAGSDFSGNGLNEHDALPPATMNVVFMAFLRDSRASSSWGTRLWPPRNQQHGKTCGKLCS